MKKKSKIKVKYLEKLDTHRKCLKYWEDEAECRERRQLASAIKKILRLKMNVKKRRKINYFQNHVNPRYLCILPLQA